jgi:hypothetical protein
MEGRLPFPSRFLNGFAPRSDGRMARGHGGGRIHHRGAEGAKSNGRRDGRNEMTRDAGARYAKKRERGTGQISRRSKRGSKRGTGQNSVSSERRTVSDPG